MTRKFLTGCAVAMAFLISWCIHLVCQEMADGRPRKAATSYCPICETIPTDGVVLVDTQTGETSTLEVWLPHETEVGESAPWEEQLNLGGYFTFVKFGSEMAYAQSPGIGEYALYFIPEDLEGQAYLCEYHAPLISTPYVLVDTHQEPKAVYAVEDGQKYQIRLNDLSIRSDGDQIIIHIFSHLFDEEIEALLNK